MAEGGFRRGGDAAGAALLALCLALQAGCGSLPGWVDPALRNAPPAHAPKVLLFAPDVQLYEISAGGIPEKVYAWGDEARKVVLDSILDEARQFAALDIVQMPELEPGERALLERHAAMFRRVGDQIAAIEESNDPVWKARERELEFTVGDGLSQLAQRSGAEAILFVDGIDFVSSTGRRVLSVLTMLAFLLPVILPGSSYLQAGLVELPSGKVLWFGRDYSITAGDLREPERARKLVRAVFKTFPTGRPGK